MNFLKIPSLLLIFILCPSLWSQNESSDAVSSGAVIVISITDPVRFIDANGRPMNEKVKVGSILPRGGYAESGKSGGLALLLSNGTVITLEPGTRMKIGTFEQEPFDSKNLKVSDLEEEPSSSKVEIDLDFGSMVVKTKKLKRTSSFVINFEAGSAEIQGTEFQLSQNAGSGMQLDVTESTVSFTPPGGSAVPVSQGQGLDVSSSGAISSRPVNPAVAQNISVKNESATQASAEVSLDVVADAMSETSSSGAGEVGSAESSSQQTESAVQSETSSQIDPSPNDLLPEELALTESTALSDDSSVEETNEASTQPAESSTSGTDSSSSGETTVDSAPSTAPASEPSGSSVSDLEMPLSEPATAPVDDLLEQNPDAKETRKSGKTSAFARRLAELSLDAGQLERFYSLSDYSQNQILNLDADHILRLLSLEEFVPQKASALFQYSPELLALLLKLDSTSLLSLLDQEISESLLLASLNDAGISASQSDDLPADLTLSGIQQKVLLLANELRISGNLEIFEEIQQLSDGVWSEDWIRIAQVGNQLSQDYDFRRDLASIQSVDGTEALSNPFYFEVSTLHDSLLLDQFDGGSNPAVVGGSALTLGSESYDFTHLLGDKSTLLLGARESLTLDGQIILNSSSETTPVILAASGGSLTVGTGTSIRSVVGDLILSARQDVLLQDSNFESAREIALYSLRDLQLRQVSLLSHTSVRIKAVGNLDVDGLQLSQSLPSLIMEATTIRLSNIDFPGNTSVQLNSLKGPIDGRYPNFGSSIPISEQVGRVNFLQNVSSGGNALIDRPSFDQFGGNISIGKLLP